MTIELQHTTNTLAVRIDESAKTGRPVTGALKTDERIIARVTDGIYREPWSAFRELISNAYDADATEVSIDCDYPQFNEIRITDNGNGMDHKTVADLLEHIGGSSKRTSRGKELGTVLDADPTKSPGGRKLIGKIGIGLFAVAQLTQSFQIVTKRKGTGERVSASILLNTYREDTLAEDDGVEDFSSGTYSVISETISDTDAQGTTIILHQIRPAIREKLQSAEIWGAIEEQRSDENVGMFDVIQPPKFHIGKISSDGSILEPPNLPWAADDTPIDKFRSLFDAAVETGRSTKEQANLAHFDNYLKMIWRLSLATPLPYINIHPFDLDADSGIGFYTLSNSKKGQVDELHLDPAQSVRDKLLYTAGIEDEAENFRIFVDTVELRRPIELPTELAAYSHHKSPLLFVGSVSTGFGGASERRSGGKLSFEAYLYWNSKIVPKESIGALIRVNGASGTLFDPEFLGYQVSEQTRKKQVTCEIYVKEGLDGALNIDRESFNTSHPHYLYIQKWLHSAFRQFATQHKKLGRVASDIVRARRDQESASELERYSYSIWSKMRGPSSSPPLLGRSRDNSGELPTQVGPSGIKWKPDMVEDRSSKHSALVDAVTLVLDAHGILERLDDEGRAELIFDLVSLLESGQ